MSRTTMNVDQITEWFLELFDEAYEGRDSQTWFVDGGSESGLFRTLQSVTAEEASAAPGGGATVASHVEHLRFALEMANRPPWPRDTSPRIIRKSKPMVPSSPRLGRRTGE